MGAAESEDISTDAINIPLLDTQISSDASTFSVTTPQLSLLYTSVGDPTPKKARKPYTLTKQRERWTEEEHSKFLQALKRYGRAWRSIEEHVGSKTAVQIRSHAQKFFSKVARESGGDATKSVEAFEIPPPRPKRKPIHPYPRKLVTPNRKDLAASEVLLLQASLRLSALVQENQSPASAVSVLASETLGSGDSGSPTGCMSTVSSTEEAKETSFFLSQPNGVAAEQMESPSPVQQGAISVQDDVILESSEILLEDDAATKKWPFEEGSTRVLKLFGRTFLVTDCDTPLGNENVKSPTSQISEGKISTEKADHVRCHAHCGQPGTMFIMGIQYDNLNPRQTAPAAPSHGGLALEAYHFRSFDTVTLSRSKYIQFPVSR